MKPSAMNLTGKRLIERNHPLGAPDLEYLVMADNGAVLTLKSASTFRSVDRDLVFKPDGSLHAAWYILGEPS